jgi:hypothetical protein
VGDRVVGMGVGRRLGSMDGVAVGVLDGEADALILGDMDGEFDKVGVSVTPAATFGENSGKDSGKDSSSIFPGRGSNVT